MESIPGWSYGTVSNNQDRPHEPFFHVQMLELRLDLFAKPGRHPRVKCNEQINQQLRPIRNHLKKASCFPALGCVQ